MATNFRLTIPGTEFFHNAEQYTLAVRVSDDERTLPSEYSYPERRAIESGDAKPVTVTFTLYHNIFGVPSYVRSTHTEPGHIYGFVDGEPVMPNLHPQGPTVLPVAVDMILDTMSEARA